MLLSHFVRVILQFSFKFLAFFRAWTPVLIISSDSFPAPRSLYFYSCLLFGKPASSGHGHGSCCDWKHASQLTYLKLQLRLGRPRLPFLSVSRHSLCLRLAPSHSRDTALNPILSGRLRPAGMCVSLAKPLLSSFLSQGMRFLSLLQS